MKFKKILPCVTFIVLTGCTGTTGQYGPIFINCEVENSSGKQAIYQPAVGECLAVNSKLNVDDAAKRKFNFITSNEMKSSPNGAMLLSSTDYGWSATSGTHYMMKKAFSNNGHNDFIQAEVSKKRQWFNYRY